MTGNLILNGAPTADNQAATKAYVDSKAGGTKSLIGSVTVDYQQSGYTVTVPQGVLLGDDFDVGIVQKTNAVISQFTSGLGSGNMTLIGSTNSGGGGLDFYASTVPTTFPPVSGREIRLHCFLSLVTLVGRKIDIYEYTFGLSSIRVTASDRNFRMLFTLNGVANAQYPALILNFYQ